MNIHFLIYFSVELYDFFYLKEFYLHSHMSLLSLIGVDNTFSHLFCFLHGVFCFWWADVPIFNILTFIKTLMFCVVFNVFPNLMASRDSHSIFWELYYLSLLFAFIFCLLIFSICWGCNVEVKFNIFHVDI